MCKFLLIGKAFRVSSRELTAAGLKVTIHSPSLESRGWRPVKLAVISVTTNVILS